MEIENNVWLKICMKIEGLNCLSEGNKARGLKFMHASSKVTPFSDRAYFRGKVVNKLTEVYLKKSETKKIGSISNILREKNIA